MTYVKGVRGRVPENLVGMKFNRLTVTYRNRMKTNRVYWNCVCECGNTVTVSACDLKSGHTKSCGCANQESRIINNTKHGYNRTPTYITWTNIIARCTNSNRPDYKNYGGRGISVCKRWLKFENFLSDMGEKPTGLSIDRIDNNGNYEPSNCKWSTPSEQRKNQRSREEILAAAEIGKAA